MCEYSPAAVLVDYFLGSSDGLLAAIADGYGE
jgi:hypothetical protein